MPTPYVLYETDKLWIIERAEDRHVCFRLAKQDRGLAARIWANLITGQDGQEPPNPGPQPDSVLSPVP